MNKDRKKYNRNWLVEILNLFKNAEYGEKDAYPITTEQIYTYCNPSNLKVKRYHTFNIPKKNGKKREISAPYRTLNNILHFLNVMLSHIYDSNPSAMGFVQGKSVVDNARQHIGHNYVFNMDLKDFFTSISEARVIARLQLPPFNFNKKLATTIGGLCAIRKDEDGTVKFVLPQGAPTSPLLSNAICDSLDKKLRGLAKKYGLHYSRYADDMTFSSMRNVYQKDGDFMRELQAIISKQGFTINEKKTRLQKKNHRQEVTGLTVNNKPNVSHQYIHDLRCIMHIWEKYGYADAYSRFYPKYKADKGHVKKGEPGLENVIEGKLNYLRMVKGESDAVYSKLRERYNNLTTHILYDKETDRSNKLLFVQSYKISKFEHKFNTKIQLRISKKDTVVGNCLLSGKNQIISIGGSTQNWLKIDGKVKTVEENTILDNPFLPSCYISLCRNKGHNFWLITKDRHKENVPVRLNPTIIPINKLIKIWQDKGLDEAAEYFELYVQKHIDNIKGTRDLVDKVKVDYLSITPEKFNIVFRRLKKKGYSDKKAKILLYRELAEGLICQLINNNVEAHENQPHILSNEQMVLAIKHLILNGLSDEDARKIAYKKYLTKIIEKLIDNSMNEIQDEMFNDDKEVTIPTKNQIIELKIQLKMKGWIDEQIRPIIRYIKHNTTKINPDE